MSHTYQNRTKTCEVCHKHTAVIAVLKEGPRDFIAQRLGVLFGLDKDAPICPTCLTIQCEMTAVELAEAIEYIWVGGINKSVKFTQEKKNEVGSQGVPDGDKAQLIYQLLINQINRLDNQIVGDNEQLYEAIITIFNKLLSKLGGDATQLTLESRQHYLEQLQSELRSNIDRMEDKLSYCETVEGFYFLVEPIGLNQILSAIVAELGDDATAIQ